MAEQQVLISEECYVNPLKKVLNAPPPTSQNQQANTQIKSIKESLDTLFPEQRYEEKILQKAKETLGSLSSEFPDAQLRDAITEIQCLADSWLDDFERQIFSGVTLRELLNEKGGT